MYFNSIQFYLFLGIAFFIFRAVPRGWRPGVLLAASLFFYASFDYLFFALLLLLISLNYFLGIVLEERRGERSGAYLLSVGLAVNLAPLVLYKKLFPEMGSVEASLQAAGLPALVVPLGISFFTFHSLSYLVDVYQRKIAAERKFTFMALYILFFPQLIAGPIMRGNELLPQFHDLQPPRADGVELALLRIYFGLFKKLVVANSLFIFVKAFLLAPAHYDGLTAIFAVICARYYIFADFSGYTDIAIGSAGLFGVSFVENFRRPFAARSIVEYWQRWHMSLSAWMRDYVYFPLLTTPVAALGSYALLVLTFSAIGLWHGFTWNFILYGAWHGIMVAVYDWATRRRRRIAGKNFDALRIAGTFLLLVCPPTVLFVTKDLDHAAAIYRQIFSARFEWWRLASLPGFFAGRFGKAVSGICVIEAVQFLQAQGWGEKIWWRVQPFRPVVYAGLVLLLLLLGDFTRRDFVYFRF